MFVEYDPEKEPNGKDLHKEYNSTTLKKCGWCKYMSGTHRYDYCIEGNCSILNECANNRRWNDECFFLTSSKNDVKSIIEKHQLNITNKRYEIKRSEEYINLLVSLKSVNRPPLPCNRKSDHFNINDEVIYHCNNKWCNGVVCYGYRHHEGLVSCLSYNKTVIYGIGVPLIMLKTEYEFFLHNIKEYDIWCHTAYSKTYNGETLIKRSL